MNRFCYYSTLLIVAVALATSIATAQPSHTATSPERYNSTDQHRQSGFAMHSTAFVENRGQVVDVDGRRRSDILYTVSAPGASLYFQKNRISYVFARIEATGEKDWGNQPLSDDGHHHEADDESPYRVSELYRMDMELVGCNPNPRVEATDLTKGYTNYYLAHCPDGITGVRSFATLTYREIYPKIDMVVRSVEGGTKCDFVVRPGGRVSDIRLRYVGADSTITDPEGRFRAVAPLGQVEEDAPYTYQAHGTNQQIIASRFRMDGDVMTFEVGDYDPKETLVIDPYRKWATYYGGSSAELILGGDPSEVDRVGNVIVTGYINGIAFPTSVGAFQRNASGSNDAYVVKFDSRGGRLWATYYGGSSDDLAHGIVSDQNQNIFIAGHTHSVNFPTSNGAFQTTYGGERDAFVVKFDNAGIRDWGTYYGGADFDDGYGFASDSAGNVAVLITTASSGLGTPGTYQPTKPSPVGFDVTYYDVLIAKLSSTGNRIWATYFGGSSTEYGYAGGSDNHQNILVTGWTTSSDLPTTAGAYQRIYAGRSDAFVLKLASDGTLRWSTYYGGPSIENQGGGATGFSGLATDGSDNVYITGHTSGNFPVTQGVMQTKHGGGTDAFAVKFDSSGGRKWATYIGGAREDIGAGIASNAVGGVLVAGRTTSVDFPISSDAFQSYNTQQNDAFIVMLNDTGGMKWGTYYGGTQNDYAEGISYDPFGSIIVVGTTGSTNFPVEQAYQGASGGGVSDAFVVLFCDIDPGIIQVKGSPNLCQGDSVTLSVQKGYTSVLWSNGAITESITTDKPGDFWVHLTNGAGCEATSDTIHVRVAPKPVPVITGSTMLCEGDSTMLDAGAGYATYLWSNGATTQQVAAKQPGDYSVVVTSQYGCEGRSDTLHVYVVPRPAPVVTGAGEFCPGDSAVLDAGPGYASYLWSNGATGQRLVVKTSGSYGVTVTNANDCAASSAMVTVRAKPGPAKPVITHDNDTLTSTSEFKYQWLFEGQPVAGADSQRYVIPKPGTYTIEVTNDEGCRAVSDPVTIYWAEAQIELGQYEAVPGQQLKIPIRMSNTVNLDNIGVDDYTLTLRFNKSVLHPMNATPTGVEDGRDRVITFNGRRGTVTDGEIGVLEFTAALGDTTETILDIESFRWLDGSGQTKTIDGKVTIDPQGGWKLYLPAGRLRLLPPHPNPTADMAQIVYETIEPGHVRLYLVDVLGRRVTSLVNGDVATGIHQLPFDPTGYPSGSYLLILETPSAQLMQPMQIQH